MEMRTETANQEDEEDVYVNMSDHNVLERLENLLRTIKETEDKGLMSRNIPKPPYLVYALLSLCAGLLLIIIIILVVIMTNNGVNRTERSLNSKLGNLSVSLSEKLEHLFQHGSRQSDLQRIINAVGRLREEIRKENRTLDPLCSSEWRYYALSCYYVSKGLRTWSNAKKYCEYKKSHLVVINSVEEQDYVSNITQNKDMWIGLTDMDGSWKWVDGTSYDTTPKFWDLNQPDDLQGQDCAHIRYSDKFKDKRWNDRNCSLKFQYICELEIS
ncbi:asialoglycoprotein receptor 1-like [Mixophyes fleayi]|uniref:asialoglycoprotein receptor 1-like n=1 Tax=Mixophyes fleayi TaxID=3061075 RepID=UPI003F4E1E79